MSNEHQKPNLKKTTSYRDITQYKLTIPDNIQKTKESRPDPNNHYATYGSYNGITNCYTCGLLSEYWPNPCFIPGWAGYCSEDCVTRGEIELIQYHESGGSNAEFVSTLFCDESLSDDDRDTQES